MLSLLEKFGIDQADAFQTEDFRFIISCGAQLESDLWERCEKLFQVRIINVFGLTETVIGGIFSGPDDKSHMIGAIGKPVDCEARIVDDKGDNVICGKPGELLMRGMNIMSGYLDSPQATEEAFLDGWFKTGDIAICNEQGIYKIVGRKKAIIISGGINIHPEEITEVLERSEKVVEAITFGVRDETWGEKVVSAVAVSDDSITENHLTSFCREHLEEVKIPDKIFILNELPKGRSGKIQINEILGMVRTASDDINAGYDNITTRVIDIASQCFKLSRNSLSLLSTPETTPGWDSLAHLELVIMLEKAFEIDFSPSEILKMESLASIKSVLENRLSEK